MGGCQLGYSVEIVRFGFEIEIYNSVSRKERKGRMRRRAVMK